jgi:hypothetical protein
LVLSVFGMGARCMTEPTTKLLREIAIVIEAAGKGDLADGLAGICQRTASKEAGRVLQSKRIYEAAASRASLCK